MATVTKPMALDETLQATNGKIDTTNSKLQSIADAINAIGGGGSLDDLSDVSITSPQDGDLLTYNGSTGEWINDPGFRDTLTNISSDIGTRNLNSYPYYETTQISANITYTDNKDGSITVVGTANANDAFVLHTRQRNNSNTCVLKNGRYKLTGCPSGGSNLTYYMRVYYSAKSTGTWTLLGEDTGSGCEFVLDGDYYSDTDVSIGFDIYINDGTAISTPLTFYPMIRDANITDETWVPYSQTKFSARSDITSIIATGSTNTTGAQIPNGAYFYLNGVFCRAIADIATNATFTKNTNYKETTVGGEIANIDSIQSVSSAIFFSSSSGLTSSTIYKFGKLYVISARLSANSSGWATAAQVDTTKYSIRNKCTCVGINGTVVAQVDLTTAGVLERYSTDTARTFDATLVALIDEL